MSNWTYNRIKCKKSIGDKILTITENGFGKRTEVEEYRVQTRGGKGVLTYKVTDKTGEVVGIKVVKETDDIILISSDGTIIRLAVKDVSVLGRNTQGVTGFIGSSGKGAKPIPLLPEEVDRILSNMGMSRLDLANDLVEGKQVKITDGPFKNMVGKVSTYDLEKKKVELLLDLFGQETSVEVDLSQIENVK